MVVPMWSTLITLLLVCVTIKISRFVWPRVVLWAINPVSSPPCLLPMPLVKWTALLEPTLTLNPLGAPTSLKERNALLATRLLSVPDALESKMICVPQTTAAKRAAKAHLLSKLKFQLRMWVEVVDPKAGKRQVAYLFNVTGADKTLKTTVRSARMIQTVLNSCTSHPNARLLVESRSFLYESIGQQCLNVDQELALIATSSEVTTVRCSLYDCLMTSGSLPKACRRAQLGLQLDPSALDDVNLLFETAIFRVHSERFLRQEWFMLTECDLRFYRSFSVGTARTIPISRVISVRPWKLPILQEDEEDGNGWFCVQLVLLRETITFVVASESSRCLFMNLLNELLSLRANLDVTQLHSGIISGASLVLNQRELFKENRPQLGLNQANVREPNDLAETLLEMAFALFQKKERPTATALAQFLDDVMLLRTVNLTAFTSSEQKTCFLLNVYHVLYIHSTLVHGKPKRHIHWKQMRHGPRYLLGRGELSVTLGDIEKMLDGRLTKDQDCGVGLALHSHDFRTSFALQLNTNPSNSIIRVYHPDQLHFELNASCAAFLAHELRVDCKRKLVFLPYLCKTWLHQDFEPGGYLFDNDDHLLMRLEKLIGFLNSEQEKQLQNVLSQRFTLNQIRFNRFWTHETPCCALALLQKLF